MRSKAHWAAVAVSGGIGLAGIILLYAEALATEWAMWLIGAGLVLPYLIAWTYERRVRGVSQGDEDASR